MLFAVYAALFFPFERYAWNRAFVLVRPSKFEGPAIHPAFQSPPYPVAGLKQNDLPAATTTISQMLDDMSEL